MNNLLDKLQEAVELGKLNKESPYPPSLRGQDGAAELAGGAPVTMEYCQKIGADFYSPDPQGAVNYLNKLVR